MNLIKKIFFIFFVMSLFSFSFLGIVLAQDPKPGEKIVDINFPCVDCDISSSTSIVEYIVKFYKFGIAIVGIVAVGMIVAGGIYISMSGAVDKKSEGKEMITSAILGIVLLFGSYIILRTINPDLVNLKDPGAFIDEKKPTIDQGAIDALGKKFSSAFCGSVASSTDLITSELPNVPGRDGYCKYRKIITTNIFSITDDGTYYNESESNIPRGSTVWSYPYFIKGTIAASTAKCLVYAYKEPDEDAKSSVTFIDLDTGLGVCQLNDQQNLKRQGEIVSSGKCTEWWLVVSKPTDPTNIQNFGPVSVGSDFPYDDASKPPATSTIPSYTKKQVEDGGYTPLYWNCKKIVDDVSSLAQCDSVASCATLFGTNPTPKYENPQLKKLMDNLRSDENNGLGKLNGTSIFDLFNHSTYDVSHPTCNQSRGKPTLADGECSHALNSCHYGGPDGDGALAIDIGSLSGADRDNWSRYCDIAKAWGLSCDKVVSTPAGSTRTDYLLPQMKGVVWDEIIRRANKFSETKNGRCEKDGGGTLNCGDRNTNHIHINAKLCNAN